MNAQIEACFSPIVARTHTFRHVVSPVAHDCVKVIVVRSGSAFLLSEFGHKTAKIGDVILLGTNVLCGGEPEGRIAVTMICLDTDYVIDQFFWQHVDLIKDRWDARDIAQTVYSEPAQVLRIGEDRATMLMPWLDELVTLSVGGLCRERFNRMQALWFSIADTIAPFIVTSPARVSSSQRARVRPTQPRYRCFTPLRTEAREVAALLTADPARPWTLDCLAAHVHLSASRLCEVFTEAYGKTPQAYLTMLRAELLAHLLRDTDLPIETAVRQVGWCSRGHAAHRFRQCVGVTPSQYRQLSHTAT